MATVKIKDNQTGQVFDVDESELGQYGLGQQSSTPTQQLQPQLQNILQYDQQSQTPTQSGGQKYITGRSLEEHSQALNAAKQSGDSGAVKFIQSEYDREYQYQKDFGSGKEKEDKKQSAALRKEFNTESKNLGFKEVQNSWNKVANADQTGAGDLTIVYSYIKALDPTTAVREGEIDLTKAAESIPNRFIKAYQRAKEGKVISDELRMEMVNEIGRIYNEKAKQQKELNAFYTGLASDSGVDPNDVIGGIGDIQFAQLKEQKKKQPTSIGGQVMGGAKALSDFLLGGTKNVVRDVVAGKTAPQITNQSNETIAVARQLMDQWEKEEDPTKKRALYDQAQSLLGQVSQNQQNISKEFSPDVNENPLLRGIGSGVELYGAAKLASSIPGFLKGIGNTPKNIKNILPKKNIDPKIIEKAGNLDTKSVVAAGDKYVSHNPIAKELWEVIKPTIKNNTKASDLIEKMFDVWKGAYTKTGDVRSKAEAQLYNKLYGASRKVIENQAPELSKQISNLRFLHQVYPAAQKTLNTGLKMTGLGKLLGL